MDKLKKIISIIFYFFAGCSEKAKELGTTLGYRLGVILIALAFLFGVAVKYEINMLLAISGGMAAIIILLSYYAGNGFIKALLVGSELTKSNEEAVKKIAEEAKNLLRPLIATSMMISVSTFVIIVWGFQAFDQKTVLVVLLFLLTILTAYAYLNKQTKMPAKVVLIISFFSFFVWYARLEKDPFATQINGWLELIGASSESTATDLKDVASKKKYAITNSKIVLRKKNSTADTLVIGTPKYLKEGSVVQFIKTKNVEGEKFATIKIPDATGSTANSDIFYVQLGVLDRHVEVYPNVVNPKYAITKGKTNGQKIYKIAFLTNKPITLSTKEFKGKDVQISGFQDGELHWNNPETGEMFSYGSPFSLIKDWKRPSCTFQAPTGTVIELIIS
ncbi:MAG: hypothetical protein WC415_05115 [Patescibacteria group bacterium]|jgi:hypothetical protein